MDDSPIIQFGNPDNPQIVMDLPKSMWQSIQTTLALQRELSPDDSEEYRTWTAIIELIKSRTGVEPEWDLIP